MRPRVHPIASSSEISEFADEVRRIFLELGRTFGVESPVGECSPTIDVYETDETIEITVDLPGVSGGAILGDGCVGLIIDPVQLVAFARTMGAGSTAA